MGTQSDTRDMADTTIRVSEELADELYKRKGRSTSYEDYIWQLLEEADGVDRDDSATESPEEAGIGTPTPTPDVDREALAEALAGSGDVLERRVDAVVEMYALLREAGAAEKSDLLGAIDVDATGYDSEASVWANMVKGRDTLRALPGVEPPGAGMSTWRYQEDTDG